MANTPKWTEERTETLTNLFPAGTYVSQADVAVAAEKLETTSRSVSSKLRKLGYEVQLASEVVKPSAWTEDLTAELVNLVENNPGSFTYAELAEAVGNGFTAKQVQGKILSLELTGNIKPSVKPESVKTYTDAEEAKFVAMVGEGAFIEDLAAALGKELNSIRGKALSLLRAGVISAIPKQKKSTAAVKQDAFDALGDVSGMTVAQIAEALGKTERGVKTLLTRREVKAADYDGAAKAAKAHKE